MLKTPTPPPAAIRRVLPPAPAAFAVAGCLALGLALDGLPSSPLALRMPTAQAQALPRGIPATARLGILTMDVFPRAKLDGRVITVGPGLRLYDTNNVVLVPSTVRGRDLRVAYASGPAGEMVEAWILTEAEFRTLRARR